MPADAKDGCPDMVTAKVFHEANVVLDISQHLLTIILAMTEGCYRGYRSEKRRLVKLVGYQPTIELLTNFLVGNDGIAAHDTSDIEGLGRCLVRDTDVTSLIGNRRKRNVLMSKERHVSVNLVRDHQDVMLIAEVRQSLQGRLVPGDATRIVRIAEHEHLALLIAHLFEVIEVHLIIAVLSHFQRIEDHLSPIALRCQAERMIDRRLNDDLLVGLGEYIDHHADALDDTGINLIHSRLTSHW